MGNQQTIKKRTSSVDDLLTTTTTRQKLFQTELTSKQPHTAIDITPREQIKGSHRGKSPRNNHHKIDSTCSSATQDQSSFTTNILSTPQESVKESCADEISMDNSEDNEDELDEIERSSSMDEEENWFQNGSYADYSSPPSAPTGLTPPVSFATAVTSRSSPVSAVVIGQRAIVVKSSLSKTPSSSSLRSIHSQSFSDQSITTMKPLINVNIVV